MSGNRFPAIAYGKTGAEAIPGPDLYRILFSSPGFAKAARQACERLAASIQWTGDGGDPPYPPCFALWPVGESSTGVLVARLTDVGRDTLGRPHTLRIEAVHVRSPEATQLASLLDDQAWPDAPWGGPDTELEMQPVIAEASVVEAIRTETDRLRRLPRLLRATHPNYRSQDFDLELDARPRAPLFPRPPRLPGQDEWHRQQRLVRELQEELRIQQAANQALSAELDRLRRELQARDRDVTEWKDSFDADISPDPPP